MSAKARTHIPNFPRHTGGATALEFAMMLPALVLLLFGIFEFGYAQHKLSSVRFAMATASRSLILDPNLTQAQMDAKVKAILQNIGDPNVTIGLNVTTTSAGKVARMTGTYTTTVGIPTLVTYPINWTTTVDTVLPTV